MNINQVHHPIAYLLTCVCVVCEGGEYARLVWPPSKWLVTDGLGTRVHAFVQTLCCKEER